jgi:hypothetical protein
MRLLTVVLMTTVMQSVCPDDCAQSAPVLVPAPIPPRDPFEGLCEVQDELMRLWCFVQAAPCPASRSSLAQSCGRFPAATVSCRSAMTLPAPFKVDR